MNKMSIIGNLTKDPELRATANGTSVCSFTVAVNRRKRTANGEDLPPMFYRVTTWRQTAESCGKFLRKGAKVFAEGDLSVSTYQANDGSTRFSLEIDARDIEFLSPKSEEASVPQTAPVPQNQQLNYTQVQISEDELPF